MSQQNDEINLAHSFAFIGRFVDAVAKGISGLFTFAIKNIILLTVFVVVGIALGFVHFKFARKVYHADLIVSSVYLDNEYCAEILSNLQSFVHDKSYNILTEKLEITPEEAKKINKIYFSNVNKRLEEKYEESDTIITGLPFRINVCVTDYRFFETLKPALLNYFDKNLIVIEEKSILLGNTERIIDKIEIQMKELDSLKGVVATHLVPRGPQTGFVFGQPLDPLNIYREVINLYKEELDKSTTLIRSAKALRVIRDFEVREKPYRPKLLISLPVGAMAGFLTGLLLAWFLSVRRKS